MADSIRTIAKLAGVSASTVSRVFSGKGYISKDVHDRVLEIARERGFQPKCYKHHSKSSNGSIVGVVIPDLSNTYFMDVLQGMQQVFIQNGIEMVVCNSDEDPKREVRLLSMLTQLGVDGLLEVPISNREAYNAQYLTELSQKGLPIVLLDRDVPDGSFDGVFMDNFGSGYLSTQTLIKNGHKDIAILCGPTTSTSGSARLSGYMAALQASGITPRADYILYCDFKYDTAYHLTKKFLDRNTDVTAIFASNSRMAQGCLYALAERGYKVPDNMGFIACGRLDGSYDHISSVIYPTEAIGKECAQILVDRIKDGGKRRKGTPRKRITFDMELVLRGSEKYPGKEQNNAEDRNTDEAETR